jgi:hypothetical protein
MRTQTGKGYAGKGDHVDALCCYRAALTMDTGVNGVAPSPATVQEATELLAATAKELGVCVYVRVHICMHMLLDECFFQLSC